MVPPKFWRSARRDEDDWNASAAALIGLLCRTFQLDDLSGMTMLDMGCGTKLTKVILDEGLPIGHYTGIDAYRDVVDWLRDNVSDPRFDFLHLDAHNELYNPTGRPLDEFEALPTDRTFDLITLFSVFTHLAPHDYTAMLRLLRRHVKPDGRLLYSLFVGEVARPGLHEELQRRLASDDPEVAAAARKALGEALHSSPETPRFVDEVPDQPLLIARYSRDYALELVDGTGWEVVELHPPEPYIQHYMVCRPV